MMKWRLPSTRIMRTPGRVAYSRVHRASAIAAVLVLGAGLAGCGANDAADDEAAESAAAQDGRGGRAGSADHSLHEPG